MSVVVSRRVATFVPQHIAVEDVGVGRSSTRVLEDTIGEGHVGSRSTTNLGNLEATLARRLGTRDIDPEVNTRDVDRCGPFIESRRSGLDRGFPVLRSRPLDNNGARGRTSGSAAACTRDGDVLVDVEPTTCVGTLGEFDDVTGSRSATRSRTLRDCSKDSPKSRDTRSLTHLP